MPTRSPDLFVKVMPHDYKRALADLEIERDDHPVSTGGGGFFTTETEAARVMGELGAFLKLDRAEPLERDPAERVHDVREFVRPLPLLELRNQGRAAWSAACRSATPAARSGT